MANAPKRGKRRRIGPGHMRAMPHRCAAVSMKMDKAQVNEETT
jgi:hypothetical protein